MIEMLTTIIQWLNSSLIVILTVPLGMTFWRMVRGPGYADRFIAVDMLTGIAVAFAALIAAATLRREFLDVALGLALISFVATCAFSAFLERKGKGS